MTQKSDVDAVVIQLTGEKNDIVIEWLHPVNGTRMTVTRVYMRMMGSEVLDRYIAKNPTVNVLMPFLTRDGKIYEPK